MVDVHRDETREDERAAAVAAARAGDEAAFADLIERHRRALQLHCYRMLGSYEESEDMVQETLLRAWRRRDSFEGRSSLRGWLYRIATNACLDALRQRPRQVVQHEAIAAGEAAAGAPAEIPWLQPYPDRLLEEAISAELQPDDAVVARETVELAFLVAIQHLPPSQRATLILRDVLGWSAKETAELLETSVASANSALQRARSTMQQQLPPQRMEWAAPAPSERERVLLQRYMDAHERADSGAVIAMLHEQARFTMPPQPTLYDGRDAVAGFFEHAFGAEEIPGDLRLVPTYANRQLAAANYVRRPGDTQYRAMSLDVLRFEDGQIAEITAFEPKLFAAFGLPETLTDEFFAASSS